MQKNILKSATLIVAENGATASSVSPDGEVEWTEGLTLGRHKGADFIPFMGDGSTLQLDGAVTAVSSRLGKVDRVAYGEGAYDTGANPDFKVTSASRAERELARLLSGLSAKSDRLERKLWAMTEVKELKQAVKPEPEPEPEPELVEPSQPVEGKPDESDTE